mgnify:CR=1 FL=1
MSLGLLNTKSVFSFLLWFCKMSRFRFVLVTLCIFAGTEICESCWGVSMEKLATCILDQIDTDKDSRLSKAEFTKAAE